MLLDQIERKLQRQRQQRVLPRTPLNQQSLGGGVHPYDATELAILLQDHGLAVSQEGSPSRLKSSSTRCSTPRSVSRRSTGLAQRIKEAVPLDIAPGNGLDWSKLVLAASTDEVKADDATRQLRDAESDGNAPEEQEPASFQVDVNSGGTVFFCLFDIPDDPSLAPVPPRRRPSAGTPKPATLSAAPAPAPAHASQAMTPASAAEVASPPLPTLGAADGRGGGTERAALRRCSTTVEDDGDRTQVLKRGQGGGSFTARPSPGRVQSPGAGAAFGRSSSSRSAEGRRAAGVSSSLQNMGRVGSRGQRALIALETVPSATVLTAWGEPEEGNKKGAPGDAAEASAGAGEARAGQGGGSKGGSAGSRGHSRNNSSSSCSSSSIVMLSSGGLPTRDGSEAGGVAGGGRESNPVRGDAWPECLAGMGGVEGDGGRKDRMRSSASSRAVGRRREGVAVLKFAGSRLLAQAEQLAGELARHVGVAAPPSRIIHQVGHTAEEWKALAAAANALHDEDLKEEMDRVPAALLMAYVPGSKLSEARDALTAGAHPTGASVTAAHASITLCEDLGRLFLLDMVLGNADRLPCRELGWRGNPGNVFFGAQGSVFAGHVVAIDACVQRRPPAAKLEHEDDAVDRLAQLVLTNPGQRVVLPLLRDQLLPGTVHKVVAASLLRTAKGGAGGGESVTFSTAGEGRTGALKGGTVCPPRHLDIAAAFQRGMRGALERVVTLKGLLEMMYQRIDEWVTEFILDMQRIVPSLQAPSTRKRPNLLRGRHRSHRHTHRARGGGSGSPAATPDSKQSQWSGSSGYNAMSPGVSSGTPSSRTTQSAGSLDAPHSSKSPHSPDASNITPVSNHHHGRCSAEQPRASLAGAEGGPRHTPRTGGGSQQHEERAGCTSEPSASCQKPSSSGLSNGSVTMPEGYQGSPEIKQPPASATPDSLAARAQPCVLEEVRVGAGWAPPGPSPAASARQSGSSGSAPNPPGSSAVPNSKPGQKGFSRTSFRAGSTRVAGRGAAAAASSIRQPCVSTAAREGGIEGTSGDCHNNSSSGGKGNGSSGSGSSGPLLTSITSMSHKRRLQLEAEEAEQGDDDGNQAKFRRQVSSKASSISNNPWSNSSKTKLAKTSSPDQAPAGSPACQAAKAATSPSGSAGAEAPTVTRSQPAAPGADKPAPSAAPPPTSSASPGPAAAAGCSAQAHVQPYAEAGTPSSRTKSGAAPPEEQLGGRQHDYGAASPACTSPPPAPTPAPAIHIDSDSYSPRPSVSNNGCGASPFGSSSPFAASASPPPPRRPESASPALPPINASVHNAGLCGAGPRDLSLTLALKAVGAEAKRDSMVSLRVTEWRNRFREHAQALKAAADEWQIRHGVERILTCGFLSGGQPVVDLYELKVRLDHMLRRLKVLQAAAVAVAPVRVCPQVPLYLGSASAADAHHVLRFLGISHILNATEEVVAPLPSSGFTVLRVPLRDVDEEDISVHFHAAVDFISSVFTAPSHGSTTGSRPAPNKGSGVQQDASPAAAPPPSRAGPTQTGLCGPISQQQGVLVHCSEGKSRSVSLVVAYMVVAQRKPLAHALHMVRSARPQAAPNAGFCAALIALEKRVLGSSSVSGPGATGPIARAAQSILGAKKPKPKPVICPICSEAVGLSIASLNVHFKSKHPKEARAEAEAKKAMAAAAGAAVAGAAAGAPKESTGTSASAGSIKAAAAGSSHSSTATSAAAPATQALAPSTSKAPPSSTREATKPSTSSTSGPAASTEATAGVPSLAAALAPVTGPSQPSPSAAAATAARRVAARAAAARENAKPAELGQGAAAPAAAPAAGGTAGAGAASKGSRGSPAGSAAPPSGTTKPEVGVNCGLPKPVSSRILAKAAPGSNSGKRPMSAAEAQPHARGGADGATSSRPAAAQSNSRILAKAASGGCGPSRQGALGGRPASAAPLSRAHSQGSAGTLRSQPTTAEAPAKAQGPKGGPATTGTPSSVSRSMP